MIEEVLPRNSELENPRIANVDTILLVFALSNPPLEPYQVTPDALRRQWPTHSGSESYGGRAWAVGVWGLCWTY
jgi:hypothetical protein